MIAILRKAFSGCLLADRLPRRVRNLHHFEQVLGCPAVRTDPALWDVSPSSARRETVLGGAQGLVVQRTAPKAHPTFEQFTIHVGLSYICVKRTQALESAGNEKISAAGRSLQENPRAKRADAEAASDLTLMAQSGSAVSPRVIGARGRRDSASQGWTLAETEQALRVEVRNFILVIHVDGQLIKE